MTYHESFTFVVKKPYMKGVTIIYLFQDIKFLLGIMEYHDRLWFFDGVPSVIIKTFVRTYNIMWLSTLWLFGIPLQWEIQSDQMRCMQLWTHLWHNSGLIIIRSVSSKIFKIDTHSWHVRARYGVFFMNLKYDLCSSFSIGFGDNTDLLWWNNVNNQFCQLTTKVSYQRGIRRPFKCTGNHTYWGLKNNWGMQSKNGLQNLWGNTVFFILC